MIKQTTTSIYILNDKTSKCIYTLWITKQVPGYYIELTDCIHGFSNCGLSYEEAKYCLCHVASDWML